MTRRRKTAAGAERLFAVVACFLVSLSVSAASLPAWIASPDNRLQLAFDLTEEGEPRYWIELNGQRVLKKSRLGLVREPREVTVELPGIGLRGATLITDDDDRDGSMSFREARIQLGGRKRPAITIRPMGGFVIAVDER